MTKHRVLPNLSQIVKRERNKIGQTQTQLAIISGVPQKTISDMEKGYTKRITRHSAICLSFALGLDFSVFVKRHKLHMNSLGKCVMSCIRIKKISFEVVAKKLGITAKELRNLMYGEERKITQTHATKIATALEIDVCVLQPFVRNRGNRKALASKAFSEVVQSRMAQYKFNDIDLAGLIGSNRALARKIMQGHVPSEWYFKATCRALRFKEEELLKYIVEVV